MALPWTLPDPDRGSPNGGLHCETCMESLPEASRAEMHCGWMDRREWREPPEGSMPPSLGPEKYTVDVCAGWLVRQPAVQEGAEAFVALEAGALDRFDPMGLNIVWELATIGQTSFNIFREHKMKQLAEKR